MALLQVLVERQTRPINIFSDRQYAGQVVHVLAFAGVKDSRTSTMLLRKDVSNQRTEPRYLSHIRSHSKLPGILTWENEVTETIILIASVDLLEQTRALHQKFHLSPWNLHKLLPKLPISSCNHWSCACATFAFLSPLGPLQCSEVNPRGLLPNAIWQMDAMHYAPFGNLKYVHVIVDTCSSFVYVLDLSGEKVVNAMKALTWAVVSHCSYRVTWHLDR